MIFFSVVCLIEGKKTRHERERETDMCERGGMLSPSISSSQRKSESLCSRREEERYCACVACVFVRVV